MSPLDETLLKLWAFDGYDAVRRRFPHWRGHRPQREVHRALSRCGYAHHSDAAVRVSRVAVLAYFQRVGELT